MSRRTGDENELQLAAAEWREAATVAAGGDARDRKLTDAAIFHAHAAGWDSSLGAEGSMLDDGRGTRIAWRLLTRRLVARPWTGSPPPGSEDPGAWCREHVVRAEWMESPPIGLVLRNRAVALWCWLAFVCARLARGRWPFARAVATPSVGRAGPWQRPSPLAFGGAGDSQAHRACPFGAGASCDEAARASGPLRRLLAGSRYTPRPDSRVVVRAIRSRAGDGWVARSRVEPEVYGPDTRAFAAPRGSRG